MHVRWIIEWNNNIPRLVYWHRTEAWKLGMQHICKPHSFRLGGCGVGRRGGVFQHPLPNGGIYQIWEHHNASVPHSYQWHLSPTHPDATHTTNAWRSIYGGLQAICCCCACAQHQALWWKMPNQWPNLVICMCFYRWNVLTACIIGPLWPHAVALISTWINRCFSEFSEARCVMCKISAVNTHLAGRD